MLEYISNIEEEGQCYDEDGNCIGEYNKNTPQPQRMKWNIPKEVNIYAQTLTHHAMFML